MAEVRRQRLWQFGAATAFVAVIVAVVVIVTGSSSNSLQHLPADRAAVADLLDGVPQHGLYLGSPKAPATLVEYADLQCPFCRDFTLGSLPSIIDRYVRPGKLRLRFDPQTILGQGLSENQSETAARFALAASLQNRLWQFTDLFYRNQDDENSGYVTTSFLTALASSTRGLVVARAAQAQGSMRVSKLLNASTTEFAKRGFSATPSFYLELPGGRSKALAIGDPSNAADFTSALDADLP